MIQTHRRDENLSQERDSKTTHEAVKIGYGLKPLTATFFGEMPQTILEATNDKSVVETPPGRVASYCMCDVWNTWRLHEFNREQMSHSTRLLLEQIDDPSNLTIARMLWKGVGVDETEAKRQLETFRNAEVNCCQEIWRLLPDRPYLTTKTDIGQFLAPI